MDKRIYSFENNRFDKVLRRFMGNFTTQQARAKTLGISQSSMSRLENGKRQPTIEELVTICNKSGYAPSDFFRILED